MRVLLDENLPVRLKAFMTDHAVATVRDMGWLGTKNGRLIALAEASFDCLLTLDQGMVYQQHLRSVHLGFLVVHSRSNRLTDLMPLVPAILKGLAEVKAGQVVVVS